MLSCQCWFILSVFGILLPLILSIFLNHGSNCVRVSLSKCLLVLVVSLAPWDQYVLTSTEMIPSFFHFNSLIPAKLFLVCTFCLRSMVKQHIFGGLFCFVLFFVVFSFYNKTIKNNKNKMKLNWIELNWMCACVHSTLKMNKGTQTLNRNSTCRFFKYRQYAQACTTSNQLSFGGYNFI